MTKQSLDEAKLIINAHHKQQEALGDQIKKLENTSKEIETQRKHRDSLEAKVKRLDAYLTKRNDLDARLQVILKKLPEASKWDLSIETIVKKVVVAEKKVTPKKKIQTKRFVKSDKGIIKDARTNLEWYVGENTDTNWHKAKEWIDELNKSKFDGGNWQMPNVKQLEELYDNGKGQNNIDPIFINSKGLWLWVWGDELLDGEGKFLCKLVYENNVAKFIDNEGVVYGKHTDSPCARFFLFDDGYDGWNSRNHDYNMRVFSVRVG